MKQYDYVSLHSTKWIGARFDGYREIIGERAKKGWRYVGCIPVVLNDYGKVKDMDLIFERDTEDPWG